MNKEEAFAGWYIGREYNTGKKSWNQRPLGGQYRNVGYWQFSGKDDGDPNDPDLAIFYRQQGFKIGNRIHSLGDL